MCPNTLAAGITAIAAAIAEGRNADEIALIGAALTQLGDTLATIAVQKNFCGKPSHRPAGELISLPAHRVIEPKPAAQLGYLLYAQAAQLT